MPVRIRDYTTAGERRKALESELSLDLSQIGANSLNEGEIEAKNCENLIGAVQVPVGVAGPLRIGNNDYYLPLATTEGALVASVSRGCKAITESGGVAVVSTRIGITRAPVFVVENLEAGSSCITWVTQNFGKLKEVTEATSSHLTLLEIKPWQVGKNVFLRFRFDTQDAMGMNMATIAVTEAVKVIEQATTARCVSVSGNMCVDKKPSFLNFIEGRGYSVSADVVISEDVLSSSLKTTLSDILEVGQRKLGYGSLLSGSIGANAQFANVLAAIFLATGQDIAHVAECASGVTTLERVAGGLYISVYLPDLVVGTVGGGTSLPTQIEALSMLGVRGGNSGKNAQKLAEIIAGAVLAGELSLLASLAEQSLATAHEKLGRGVK